MTVYCTNITGFYPKMTPQLHFYVEVSTAAMQPEDKALKFEFEFWVSRSRCRALICLGMTDFCCCDMDHFVAEKTLVKRKQLDLVPDPLWLAASLQGSLTKPT